MEEKPGVCKAIVRYADSGRFPNDTIDGETVLIDARKGHLFLFTGIGSQIWQRLGAGASLDALIAEVVSRYGETAATPTLTFFQSLEGAEMLCEDTPSTAASAAGVSWPSDFVAPALERYDQIADIIAMDPIHEVDPGKGWPHRRAEER